MKMRQLSHVGADGRAQMVDVSTKPMSKNDQVAKGNVLATARIAGIQAAKQTAQLIPLCHTLPLGEVKVDIVTSNDGAEVKCTAQTIGQTGVEMEALVGATVALLTIYDMCKAVDKEMRILDVHLLEKIKSVPDQLPRDSE